MPVMIPGLLVADDSLLVAKSVADLEVALKRAESWAQIHNLRFGLKKCGIMMIGPAIQTEANVKTLERAKIMLQGAPIPVVTSYTYLGGVFQSDLSFEGVIADRCRKAQGSISTIMPVITNASVPLAMRRLTVAYIYNYSTDPYLFGRGHWDAIQKIDGALTKSDGQRFA